MKETIKLNKKIFGTKGTKDKLDETFKEFTVKEYKVEEFFDLYQQLFYDINKLGRLSHTTIVAKSTEYAGTPPNPKDQTILELQERRKEIQWAIDSIEEEHPFLPNNRTVVQSRNEPSLKYYIQSGRRRKINTDEVFTLLKTRAGFPEDSPNEDFSVLLNADAIAGIMPGPDINSTTDLNLDTAYVNRFTPGVNMKDPLSNITIPKLNPDLRNNIPIPEINNYNPMVNIEEIPPTPKELELQYTMNTDAFNKSTHYNANIKGSARSNFRSKYSSF